VNAIDDRNNYIIILTVYACLSPRSLSSEHLVSYSLVHDWPTLTLEPFHQRYHTAVWGSIFPVPGLDCFIFTFSVTVIFDQSKARAVKIHLSVLLANFRMSARGLSVGRRIKNIQHQVPWTVLTRVYPTPCPRKL